MGNWDKVIQPNSSYLIIGDVGTGKSALAYWLLEIYSQRYNLLPTVVGLPRDKQNLLPDNFVILEHPSECTTQENTIAFIDEADLQLPIEDTKARKSVVNFLSLPRHRKQIFLLAFHFPRLVLGRYLPFFSAFLLKRPPYLIEFAGKRQNDALVQMMERAEERFSELPTEEILKNTYVVAPRIRWQGMIENPLPSFWGDELSEVWAGVEMRYNEGMERNPSPERRRWVAYGEERPPAEFSIVPVTEEGVIVGFHMEDPTGRTVRDRDRIATFINNYFPEVSKEEVANASIAYGDFSADVRLPR